MESRSFGNASFDVEMVDEGGCLVSLKIFVKALMAQKLYRKAVKKVNRQISVPGFRKGRAPDATVIGRYGTHVEQEWKDLLVNEAYRAGLELTDVYPMSRESIQKPQIESCSQEEGAVVRLSYEHYPEVPEIQFSEISLPVIEKEPVSEERVEEVMHEVCTSHADWEEVTGRAVEVGDYADVSIDAIDQEPPKPIVSERRFEVRESRMAPWLCKLLVGMEIGGSAEGVSEVDETADEQVKATFKPTKVRVTVHAIKRILLPEIDDELAKKVGAESKEDLYAKIRANLDAETESVQKQKQIAAFEEALLEKYPFDLPASMVEAERRERIEREIKAMKEQNLSDEEIKGQEKVVEERVSRELDAALRLYFLNKQIMKQGNISVTNQELNDEVVRQISQNPALYGRQMDDQTQKEMVNRMASSLMLRKAKEYALSQVLG